MTVSLSDFVNNQKKRREISQKKDTFNHIKNDLLFEVEKQRQIAINNKKEDQITKLNTLKQKITATNSIEKLEIIAKEYTQE